MLAQIYAAIIYDRYCDMIAAASAPADLGRVSAMLDDAKNAVPCSARNWTGSGS